LGVTEQSDAVAVIVSEENGNIAMAVGGVLMPNLSADELEKRLKEALV
jgi:DNA integrity scanning protein DisA with diadenylate cyclase activity